VANELAERLTTDYFAMWQTDMQEE